MDRFESYNWVSVLTGSHEEVVATIIAILKDETANSFGDGYKHGFVKGFDKGINTNLEQ